MSETYIHGKHVRPDGTADTFWSVRVESKDAPMAHHLAGLQWTATGYGSRIPSRTMVRFNGRWRRVYVRIYSNTGTAYIGRLAATGEQLIVRDYA